MNGFLVCDTLFLPKECVAITDEFQKGMYCEQKYEQVLEAKQNWERRLGVENEDEDVEMIINNMNDIMRHLALKMYDYGKEASYKSSLNK